VLFSAVCRGRNRSRRPVLVPCSGPNRPPRSRPSKLALRGQPRGSTRSLTPIGAVCPITAQMGAYVDIVDVPPDGLWSPTGCSATHAS
jgi:hypothetical protein